MGTAVLDAHVPDITTQAGLLDIIAVGCVLEFSSALNIAGYSGSAIEDEDAAIAASVEAGHARARFRVIMKSFGTRYTTIVADQLVHPSYIWNRILVQFGAALVNYMKKQNKVAVKAPGVSAKSIAQAVQSHLTTDHPHLVLPFQRELKKNPTSLTWNGLPIHVIRRSAACDHVLAAVGIEEGREMLDSCLYMGGDDSYYQGEWSGDDSDDPDTES